MEYLNYWRGVTNEHPNYTAFCKTISEFLISDNYSEVSVEVLLFQICEALSDLKEIDSQNNPNWVDGLKELLHYDNSTLSLDYLSKELKVHPVHISRVASKYLSMSLGEYIRKHKLKTAIPLLLDANNSLTTIAHRAGFSDQSHFNHVFKSIFNSSPSSYRKIINKNL